MIAGVLYGWLAEAKAGILFALPFQSAEEAEEAVEDRERMWRPARNVEIDGQDRVGAVQHLRMAGEGTTGKSPPPIRAQGMTSGGIA